MVLQGIIVRRALWALWFSLVLPIPEIITAALQRSVVVIKPSVAIIYENDLNRSIL